MPYEIKCHKMTKKMPFNDILGLTPCVIIFHFVFQDGYQKNRIDQRGVKNIRQEQNLSKIAED